MAATSSNGYAIKPLANGDCIVTIRHDGCRSIVVEGDDPQEIVDEGALTFAGNWEIRKHNEHFGAAAQVASADGASVALTFEVLPAFPWVA